MALFQRQADLNFIDSTNPQERFNIYKNTIMFNLSNALSLTFPGIWQLLGKTCADNIASAFCSHPDNFPISGCLDDWGEKFPAFLASIEELKILPYLKDYAYYEWVKHQAYLANKTEAITLNKLSQIQTEKFVLARIAFLPSVYSYSSKFPIDEIQKIIDNSNSNAINLSNNQAFAIIYRHKDEINTIWVAKDLWTFFDNLKQGNTIAQAIKKTLVDFDLTTAFHFLFEKQLIREIII